MHAVHMWVLQAACLLVQAPKGCHAIQPRGCDTELSTNASKDTVRIVHMVEIADCKTLLSLCSSCHLGVTFTLRTHMHTVSACGLVANNRFCLCLAFFCHKVL